MLTSVGLTATTLTVQLKTGDLADVKPGLRSETLRIATLGIDAATSLTLEALNNGWF